MKRSFHSRASRDVRPRRQSAARRSMVSPGARLVRVGRVGRVEGGSFEQITTRPLVWNFSTFQPFNFLRYTWMAIDNELGRRWSSTPDKYRYENASFAEDTREYNSLEVDCESRAKKLKTIENIRTEYTKREMWSLLRKDK